MVTMKQDRSRKSGHKQALNAQDHDQLREENLTWQERDANRLRAIARQLEDGGWGKRHMRRYNGRSQLYFGASIDFLRLCADEIERSVVQK